MKSFVTGGAGFLGSAVVSRLLARGDDVVALARSEESATKLTRLGALPVRGEITDARTLDQLLTGVDLVFHIAGDYRVGIKESDHEEMFRTNVDGTTIVLDGRHRRRASARSCTSPRSGCSATRAARSWTRPTSGRTATS